MTRTRRILLTTIAVFFTLSSLAAPPERRRALLIGINDYTASGLRAPRRVTVPKRDWANLEGAVNDVLLMRELLIARYGFAPADIVMLTDQQATRDAIERSIRTHLFEPARKDDVLLFYYSGHGSQVRNSLSDEPDRLDESLVPADSRLGAHDIHDKDLRRAFNCILDRGARLTIVLDACHSGSGARGLSGGLRSRGVLPDPRDVADGSRDPRPEDRGALVIAASEDFDSAYETFDDKGEIRGALSWALARTLRDIDRNEPVSDLFLRVQARLKTDKPAQNPILAGRADVQMLPFLGTKGSHTHRPRATIAIESVSHDGTYRILGGWAHGLTVGTRLRPAGGSGVELEVTALIGAGRAAARLPSRGVQRIAAHPVSLSSGTLLEISAWAAPPVRRLRVWIPEAPAHAIAEARKRAKDTADRGLRLIADPTEVTPATLVRWRNDRWEDASSGASSTAFIQVPVCRSLADAVGEVDGAQFVDGPETADYILTGRITGGGIEYAWVRPQVTSADGQRSLLPLRTTWTAARTEATALELRHALRQLILIHGWHELESPGGHDSHYRLAIRDASNGSLIEGGPLVGTHEYQLVLRLHEPARQRDLYTRYVYVFVVDSHGRSVLLYPRPTSGSVENRLPTTTTAAMPIRNPPAEIALDPSRSFVVTEPYGRDTYFLLSTDTPLSSTACLEWEGVRTVPEPPRTPLELLLAQSASGTRGEPIRTPPDWSIEKVVFESVPPRRASR